MQVCPGPDPSLLLCVLPLPQAGLPCPSRTDGPHSHSWPFAALSSQILPSHFLGDLSPHLTQVSSSLKERHPVVLQLLSLVLAFLAHVATWHPQSSMQLLDYLSSRTLMDISSIRGEVFFSRLRPGHPEQCWAQDRHSIDAS